MANWIDLLRDGPNPADIGGAFVQGQAQTQALRSAQLADVQRRQAVADQQQYRSRVQSLLAGGDIKGAAAQAAAFGDDKASTNFIALQKNQYDQGATGAGAMGEVVRGISSLPYEQRRGALAAAAPTLQAMGYGQDQIAAFDPTDQNLAAVGGIGYSATQRAGDQQAAFNGDTARQAENFAETKPIVIDHDAFDPVTGELRFRAQNTQVLAPGATLYNEGTAQGGGVGGAGGGGYDTVIGNGRFGSPPSALSSMTVGAVVDYGRKVLIPATRNNAQLGLAGTGMGSSAVGRYQITSGTLRRYAPQVLGADWQSRPFDAAAQDRLGEAIFNDSRGGDLSKVWTSLSPAQAAQVSRMPWSQAREIIAQGESGGSSAPRTTPGGAVYTAPAKDTATAGVPGLDPSLTGDAVLKALPAPMAAQVKGLVEGRQVLPARFAASPAGQAVIAAANQYDPNFDMVNYNARAKTRQDFTSGKSAVAVTAFDTLAQHVDALAKDFGKLDNGNYPMINGVRNSWRNATGDGRTTAFSTDVNAVAAEAVRAFRGVGGAVSDIQDFQRQFNAASSPEQAFQAVRALMHLVEGRTNALQTQYQRGMGTTREGVPGLSPQARAAFKRYGGSAATQPSTAPAAAQQMLRANPALRAKYEAKYGAGSAAAVLGR
jgi:hypothetical protein